MCSILTACCKTSDQQNILVSSGILQSLTAVLASHVASVQLAGLLCLAEVVYANDNVAGMVMNASYEGKALISLVSQFTGREYGVDIQLASGRILTYLYRLMAIPEENAVIVFRVLPCLVRMCMKEETTANRIVAADTLTYLIEVCT